MSKPDEPIIHFDSPEAAQLVTVSGWRSRRGFFCGDDERTARYDGCTHRNCEDCGKLTEKNWLVCDECRHKKSVERFLALPRAPWDGFVMLYSDALDRYFNEPGDIDMEEGQELDDLRIVLCTPNYPRQIDPDDFSDDLPDDGDYNDLPGDLIEAIEAFNKVARACKALSWSPGKTAWNGNVLIETVAKKPAGKKTRTKKSVATA